MSNLVLDAGALIAADRGDRAMARRLLVTARTGGGVRTTGPVVGQVWRDASGRQANLARMLSAIEVVPVGDRLGRDASVLLGRTGSTDVVDATVVAVANSGDQVITSDPADIGRLVLAAGRPIRVVRC